MIEVRGMSYALCVCLVFNIVLCIVYNCALILECILPLVVP